MNPGPTGSTLRWSWPPHAPADLEAGLTGPGAPFELVVGDVLGQPLEVFAQRPASMTATLAQAADRHGDLPYLVFADEPEGSHTYAEVHRASRRWAALLAEGYGVGPGDRVAVVSANCLEYVLVSYAAVALGATLVGANGWWTAAELDHGLDLTDPVLVTGDERRLARLHEAGSRWAPASRPFAQLAAEVPAAEASAPTHEPDEDDAALVLFTSGTTGRAKGAVLTHRNLAHMATAVALGGAIARFSPPVPAPAIGQATAILAAPFFHVSGVVPLFATAPRFGNRLVLPRPGRWDEAAHLRLSEAYAVTSWSAVPTQLWRLIDHPAFATTDLSTLRTIGVGGAMVPVELVRRIGDLLPDVRFTGGYGMTETMGSGTRAGGADLVAHPGSVGRAEPGMELQVRADDGTTVLPDGEIGEIHIRGASVFLRYWNDDGATAAAFDDARWYRTGDFGRIEDGRLHLESRIRDLIIRGGENVYPLEVENRLLEHPDIDEAAVIGIEDRVLGQEVGAVLVPRAGAILDVADVQAWCAAVLAPFKVPARVEVRRELPTTASGKVMKHLLEAEAAARPAT